MVVTGLRGTGQVAPGAGKDPGRTRLARAWGGRGRPREVIVGIVIAGLVTGCGPGIELRQFGQPRGDPLPLPLHIGVGGLAAPAARLALLGTSTGHEATVRRMRRSTQRCARAMVAGQLTVPGGGGRLRQTGQECRIGLPVHHSCCRSAAGEPDRGGGEAVCRTVDHAGPWVPALQLCERSTHHVLGCARLRACCGVLSVPTTAETSISVPPGECVRECWSSSPEHASLSIGSKR